jgi:COP9 signalosome complex subunit 2
MHALLMSRCDCSCVYCLPDSSSGTHLDSMILDFHRRAILQTLKSYRRLKLAFLAARLRVTVALVETILVQLILDGEIAGRIDQVAGVLDLTQSTGGAKKYAAIHQWASTLSTLTLAATQSQTNAAY